MIIGRGRIDGTISNALRRSCWKLPMSHQDLEYASPSAAHVRYSGFAIVSFLAGLFSCPLWIAVTLAHTSDRFGLHVAPTVRFLFYLIPPIAAVVLGDQSSRRIAASHGRLRGLQLADWSFGLGTLWLVLVLIFLLLAAF